jgi:hypothetical protein
VLVSALAQTFGLAPESQPAPRFDGAASAR